MEKDGENPVEETKNEGVETEKKQHPPAMKKIRVAILTGYNGVNFHGSQKN